MPLPMKIASRPKFLSAFDGFRASSSHRIGPQNLDPGIASCLFNGHEVSPTFLWNPNV